MPGSIANQIGIFFYSAVGGMIIAYIYDLFRIKRKRVKTKALVIHFEDFIYWIIVAFVMLTVAYYSNDGEFRGFVFAGAFTGVIIYTLFISRIVTIITLTVLRIIYKAAKIFWQISTYPFRVILRFLGVPASYAAGFLRKLSRIFRRSNRIRISRVLLLRRMIKNKLKKI